MAHFMQRTTSSGSLYIGQYTDSKGDNHGPFTLIGDSLLEVPKEVAEYFSAAYDSVRHIELTPKQATKASQAMAEQTNPDVPDMPGDAALLVDDKGRVTPTQTNADVASRTITASGTEDAPSASSTTPPAPRATTKKG